MADSTRTPHESTQNQSAARWAWLTRTSVEIPHSEISTAPPRQQKVDTDTTSRTSISTLTQQAETSSQSGLANEPPTYDDLYPPAPAAVSRCPAKPHSAPPQGMDPLVAAIWHNENLSLLHALPNHLLVEIISTLDNRGIECLRRAARRFPPLCVREVLSPRRSNKPQLSETGPFNWPTFGVSSPAQPRPYFLDLIDRDEYCSGCQAARRSSRWHERLCTLTEYIHCSACGADHPACLFSATQRLRPARLRYCIGHEGFMRVCEHQGGVITLSRLSGIASESTDHRRRPWQRQSDIWQTILCRDMGHVVQSIAAEGGAFADSEYSCGSRVGLCWGICHPCIVGGKDDLKNRRTYDIHWAAGIRFDGQMSTLRERLAELEDNVGKYVVPRSATAKESPALCCLDPNDCHCVTYEGSENVRWDWERGPWLPGTTGCMSDPYKGLNALIRPPEAVPESTMSKITRRLKRQLPTECAIDQKSHQSRDARRPPNRGVGKCFVDIRPAHADMDCLKVEYLRVLKPIHDGKITPQWYNTLDPESYNVTEDEDGLGVFWCQTTGCRNYFKGVLNYAGILRHREFRKECQHDNCEQLY